MKKMETTKWLRLNINCHKCKVPFIYKYRTLCEHCKEAYYCSSECCYKDKISHKKDCKGLSLLDSKTLTNGPDFDKVNSREKWFIEKVLDTSNSQPSSLFCLHCDKSLVGIKPIVCHKCQRSFYCSKACADTAAPIHSLICETAALFHYVQDCLYHGQTYQTLKEKGLSDSIDIRPFIDSIHNEFCPELFRHEFECERAVVVLQIVGPYPQSWQYAILTRDIQWKTVHIMFYHDETTKASMTGGPNLEPYSVAMVPLADCLKPGNFIILLDPWFHTFLDLTHGIRIDSLEAVHFVWKD